MLPEKRRDTMQSVLDELKTKIEKIDLWSESTNDDRCDNCRFYKVLREDIGYCIHKEVELVVGGPWWCKLYAPDQATAAARKAAGSSQSTT